MRIGKALAARCLELAGESAPPLAEMISEKKFQAAVIEVAEWNGWKWHHQTISKKSVAGWPDLVLVRGSVFLIRELKVGDNKPDAAQLDWLDALQAAGVDAAVWYADEWPLIVATLISSKKAIGVKA